jgi:hypothetical protein
VSVVVRCWWCVADAELAEEAAVESESLDRDSVLDVLEADSDVAEEESEYNELSTEELESLAAEDTEADGEEALDEADSDAEAEDEAEVDAEAEEALVELASQAQAQDEAEAEGDEPESDMSESPVRTVTHAFCLLSANALDCPHPSRSVVTGVPAGG